MIAILLLSLFSPFSHAENQCDTFMKFEGFKKQTMGERPRLSSFNEYLNLFGIKDRHLPKKFEEFKNGSVLALRFQNAEKKTITLFLVESGHLLGVYEGKNQWYCEKEK